MNKPKKVIEGKLLNYDVLFPYEGEAMSGLIESKGIFHHIPMNPVFRKFLYSEIKIEVFEEKVKESFLWWKWVSVITTYKNYVHSEGKWKEIKNE